MSEWISVDDRLPEEQYYSDDVEKCLIYIETDGIVYGIQQAFFYRGHWRTNWISTISETVTHWMPLPAPPEA